MKAKTLMIQGTTSDAGKSTIAAGLCRSFTRRGFHVAPFKSQNMSLNSAVTVDGGEIGRAQALQAIACGIEPHTDMNPILLKPNSTTGAQLIIQGKAIGNMDARSFHQFKPKAMPIVMQSFERLKEQFDLIIVEGAGSPAEINLRDGDIANMGFAERADCPVLLVADIDKGGVFAHIFGTLALLSASEQQRTKGFIINKFRGDPSLLTPGIDWLTEKTGKPTLGIMPLMKDFLLDAEDSLSRVGSTFKSSETDPRLRVIVADIPSMSNHTDFEPLAINERIELKFVKKAFNLEPADLIILPGSKSVLSDLAFLENNGWRPAIGRHLRYGGKVIGICGGFQMLGTKIYDPLGIESDASSGDGFGYLEIETTLDRTKQLLRCEGQLNLEGRPTVAGYEIHCGISKGKALASPAIFLKDRADGAISKDGNIMGTYFHGLFEQKHSAEALLRWAGQSEPEAVDYPKRRGEMLDYLADQLEQFIGMDFIDQLLGAEFAKSCLG